jgi:hypothetical protein
MTDRLTQALYYAEALGWYVFPAPPGEKKSHKSAEFSDGRPWGATRDLDEITRDFTRWPDAMVGVRTGAESGFIVIEGDTKEGHGVDGIASLAALEVVHGVLPATLQAESPSGSIHYYFKHPGFPVKNSASDIAPGVDVRGDGGMVIAPPSVKPGKGAYRWRNQHQIAEAPAWLLDTLRASAVAERPIAQRAVTAGGTPAPQYDFAEVKALYEWLADNNAIETRDEWILTCGGAAKYEFGDDGFELFEIVCHGGKDDDGAKKQWNSLKPDHKNPRTLRSVMDIAHKAGWKGSIQKATGVMFASLAPLVASLPPPPAQAATTTMMAGTQAIVDLGTPIVAAFNAAHQVVHALDAPVLPLDLAAAPLRGPLTEALGKLITLAERDRGALRFDTFGELLAVLSAAHDISLAPVVARIRSAGTIVPDGRLKRAIKELENAVVNEARTSQGWITNSRGDKPDPLISENVDVLLAMLHTELRFNEFARQVEFKRGEDPWRNLTSNDLDAISYEANSATHRFHVTPKFLYACMTTIARRRTYDPLTDWIDTLQWDGHPRLEKWLHHACGAPADPYHAAVGHNVIGGLVKRARDAGCKHDEILLLIGRQGVTKSGLASALMPDQDWYADTVNLKRGIADLIPEISGKWLIEWSELAGKSKSAVEDVKAFISRRTDRYTKKFENIAGDHPRRMIFVATSNDDEPLQDATGGRRFLPVRVLREINIKWIEANRNQMFAEAAALYATGERFGIPRELWGVAGEHQENARSRPMHEIFLADWFAERVDPFFVTSKDLVDALRRAGASANNIGEAMKGVGLKKCRTNRIADFWITTDADVKTTPRVKLADQRVGDAHSKVTWLWPMTSARPPIPPPY